jgi:5'/3'-nucleotidase SurE
MNPTRRSLLTLAAVSLLALPATNAAALDLLVTNDDGVDSPGLAALQTALAAAGHNVTVVAPADQQSGKGGSINTEVFDFAVGGGTMALVNRGGGVWSLAGTPADCVKAGLDVVLQGVAPDLVVSGLNSGQNIGKPGSNASGTEGAALQAVFRGIPSIAGSVGLDISESPDFPSTQAAYAPASAFIVDVIAALEAQPGDSLMPERVNMLNINFPVPYGDIQGVAITRLGNGGDLELPLFDPSQGFPAFGIPPLPFPPCASTPPGGVCFATVGLGFAPPNGGKPNDQDEFRAGFISITPMDADMSAGNKAEADTEDVLGGLTP